MAWYFALIRSHPKFAGKERWTLFGRYIMITIMENLTKTRTQLSRWKLRKTKFSCQFQGRRWLVFFFAGTLFMLSQFYRSSVAVIAPNLIQDLNLDAWELSTVSASFFYAFALMQIPPGSRGLLPAPSPLRTGRETFTSSGSSIDKACGHTRQLFSFPTSFEIVLPYRIIWIDLCSNLYMPDEPGRA